MRQDGEMEVTDRNNKPKGQQTLAAPAEQPRQAPLTGRAAALAAVARLYDEHGDELKQLADA
jgi:hypothetical protein